MLCCKYQTGLVVGATVVQLQLLQIPCRLRGRVQFSCKFLQSLFFSQTDSAGKMNLNAR
jgi:hypothetical protein